MRFAFVSHEGSGLPFWLRVKDEGHEVRAYVPDRGTSFVHRETGKGLIPRASSLPELIAWGSAAPTVFVFDCTEEGSTAEALRRRGHLVIGGGEFCDKLEMDRAFGEKIAQTIGVRAPATHTFPSISATIAFLKGAGAGSDWYFKTNDYLAVSTTSHGDAEKLIRRLESYRKRYRDGVSNILQETIEGSDISTACWWGGRDWLPPFEGTIESKALMTGGIGPATGCSFNVVWWYDGAPKIANELRFGALAEVFRAFNAPAGIYDINAIISKADKLPYFLEWTPRFGYDAEPTAMRAIQGELAEFYYNLATGRAFDVPFDRTKAQMSVRVSVQPYPWEAVHELPSAARARASGAVGVPVGGPDPADLPTLYAGQGERFMAYGLGLDDTGELVVVDPTGIVGLVCADGTDPERMNEAILAHIEDELDVPDLQYRTDGGEVLTEHLAKIEALGYETGPL